MIRPIEINDVDAICEIYNYYITKTIISFEERRITVDEMKKRIKSYTSDLPWIVYEEKGEVVGYAYASPWRSRPAYRYSAEVSVYVSNDKQGLGIGTKLYRYLIPMLSNFDIHRIIGGIALPNEKSVRLHEKMGFNKVAHFTEVGYKFDRWIDVGYWEFQYDK